MVRTPSGSLGAHFEEECTSLARLLTIRPATGDPVKLTDLDTDIEIPSRAVKATGGPLTAEDTETGPATASDTLTITSGNNALNGETVVMDILAGGTKTYTAQTALTNVDGNFLIGVDRSATLLNLADAINLGPGSGSTYAAATTAHPDGLIATPPSQSSTTTNQVSQTGGSVIGNMTNFSNVTGLGGTSAQSFDGVLYPWHSRTSRAPSGSAAYVGKNFTGSPIRVSQAIVYGSNNQGWWEPGGRSALRMEIQLRAATGSFPGATGGTLLGTTGQFTNPVASGTPISPNRTITSSDDTTEWDFVWVAMIEHSGVAGQYIMGEVQFRGTSVAQNPGAGDMGLEAPADGEIYNDITLAETLTNGSWANGALVGGAGAKFNVLDGETVSLGLVAGGAKTYTFQDTLTDVDGNVQIGADAAESLDNLKEAINLGPGAGTAYAASMTVHPDLTASVNVNGLFVEATVAGTASNGLALTETLSKGEWAEPFETAGGEDSVYLCEPGFTASATMSSSSQGIQGLDIVLPENANAILQTDLLSAKFSEAEATLEYVNWTDPEAGGQMTLFGGVIGDQNNTDEKEISLSIQGKFTRNRSINIETYSTLCRADLGDERCKFDIDDGMEEFEITVVTNQTIFETTGLTASFEDGYWDLGVVQFTSGDNEGVAIEVTAYTQTNGQIKLYLPAPLTLSVGDTGKIWQGCDKTLATCRDKFANVLNFRGEPYTVSSSIGQANR